MQDCTTLSDTEILDLIKTDVLRLPDKERILKSDDAQKMLVQPSSYDLRAGNKMWLMKGSIKPTKDQTVEDILSDHADKKVKLSKRSDATLFRDETYLIELQESLNLEGTDLVVRANSKSSIGRIDLQTRLVSDYNHHYDKVLQGHNGKLYLQAVANSFFTGIREGDTLNQIMFSKGDPRISDAELHSHLLDENIVFDMNGKTLTREGVCLDDGIPLSIDLSSDIVGYEAKKTGRVIGLRDRDLPAEEFWTPIYRPESRVLRLEPGKFYILSSKEAVAVPKSMAGELMAVDTTAGNFTSHFAGFFDPQFGYDFDGTPVGSTTTFEVRVHNTAELIQDGQRIGLLKLERLSQLPNLGYGQKGRNSNYGMQTGPRLSKYFDSSVFDGAT